VCSSDLAKVEAGPGWAGFEAYQDRNPAWVSAGREVDSPDGSGKLIVWSEPEILLYDDDPAMRLSYPDLIEEDGRFWVTETQKTIARVHPIEPRLLDALFRQHELNTFVADDTLLLQPTANAATATTAAPASSRVIAMPVLPEFCRRDQGRLEHTRSGFTLDFTLAVPPSDGAQAHPGSEPVDAEVLLDTFTPNGEGLRLTYSNKNHNLALELGDPRQRALIHSDPLPPASASAPGARHHVSIIVDGGSRIVMFVVDGKLQDGGDARQFGWSRFSPTLVHCNGLPDTRVSSRLTDLRIYSRALLVSEAVGHARAAAKPR
jgi:hypothetical protein